MTPDHLEVLLMRPALAFPVLFLAACEIDLSLVPEEPSRSDDTGTPDVVTDDPDVPDRQGPETPDDPTSPTKPTSPSRSPGRVVGYFAEWGVYARDYQVEDVPADDLTHINYAFVQIVDGRCAVYDRWAALEKDGGNVAKLRALTADHPHLSVMMSIGGWTLSGAFSDVAATQTGRDRLVDSCVDLMVEWGMDGIDVDWEYPVVGGLSSNTRPEDGRNLSLLLEDFRRALDARGGGELTIAGPGGIDKIEHHEIAAIAAVVDFVNVMTYDFAGAWDNRTGHHAGFDVSSQDPGEFAADYNVTASVQHWLDGGLPPDQLVVGVPLYGRSWRGVPATHDGRFQSATGPGPGTFEPGVLDYEDIVDNYLGQGDWVRTWDAEAMAPTLYSASQQSFVSYEDPESLGLKLDWIRELGLGGVMFWELSGDTDDHALVAQMAAALE